MDIYVDSFSYFLFENNKTTPMRGYIGLKGFFSGKSVSYFYEENGHYLLHYNVDAEEAQGRVLDEKKFFFNDAVYINCVLETGESLKLQCQNLIEEEAEDKAEESNEGVYVKINVFAKDYTQTPNPTLGYFPLKMNSLQFYLWHRNSITFLNV